VIPTNVPLQRADHSDRIYLTFKEKMNAVIEEIKEIYKKGQPILIGTISVEKSEIFSNALRHNNIRHNVLNAKNHAREADIIAGAGRISAVTIATNMAGRGTDIKLGGERKTDEEYEALLQEETTTVEDREILLQIKDRTDKMQLEKAEQLLPKLGSAAKKGAELIIQNSYDWIEDNKRVKELGGLFILGTERHESRRIDNQLRGRSGRQGDDGASRFYISLEDDLMRLFGGERIQKMLSGMGMEPGEPIEHPWISNAIEKAQKKVETRNFEMRKHLLEYDDVLNKQRNLIYQRRDEILADENIIERIIENSKDVLGDFIDDYQHNLKTSQEFALTELTKQLKETFFIEEKKLLSNNLNNPDNLCQELEKIILKELTEKDKILGHEYLNLRLRGLYLLLIDKSWQDHLENMEQLREAVYLRAYSNKNPLTEYKIEGSNIFDALIDKIKTNVIKQIFRVKIETVAVKSNADYSQQHESISSFSSSAPRQRQQNQNLPQPETVSTQVINSDKIGRNDPCPCGSGKKYKKCCGK
jgi:preprotein translocase subunit SecA